MHHTHWSSMNEKNGPLEATAQKGPGISPLLIKREKLYWLILRSFPSMSRADKVLSFITAYQAHLWWFPTSNNLCQEKNISEHNFNLVYHSGEIITINLHIFLPLNPCEPHMAQRLLFFTDTNGKYAYLQYHEISSQKNL